MSATKRWCATSSPRCAASWTTAASPGTRPAGPSTRPPGRSGPRASTRFADRCSTARSGAGVRLPRYCSRCSSRSPGYARTSWTATPDGRRPDVSPVDGAAGDPGRSRPIAQLHVPAHGLEVHVSGAPAARTLQRAARHVLAGAPGFGIEAVGDIAAEGRNLVGITALGAGAHVQVAADGSRVETGATRQVRLDAHVAGGAARTHRARRVE